MAESVLQIRPSRVLKRMRDGKVALCTKVNLVDSRVVEIIGRLGFDCVWADMEHVPNSTCEIENQVRAAKMHDMDCLVRVRRGSYSDLIVPLEMDATGIMVPHLMNLQEAKQIVYYTKFHPIGRRPWDGGNSDGAYCMIPSEDYIRQANRERFVVVQIEDPEVLDDLEAIAQLEGIDMLFFGPADFSQGIGHLGQFDHPEVIQARQRVVEVARKHGKFAGTVSGVANFSSLVDMGYQFINVGADVLGLCQYFGEIVSKLSGQIK